MDVRAIVAPCAILALTLCGGCALFEPKPQTSPEKTSSPRQDDPPQIVEAKPTSRPAPKVEAEATEGELSGVEKWAQSVARRDDLRARAHRGEPQIDPRFTQAEPAIDEGEPEEPIASAPPFDQIASSVPPAHPTMEHGTLPTHEPNGASGSGAAPPTIKRVTVRPDQPVVTAARPTPAPIVNSPQTALGSANLADFIDAYAPAGDDADFRRQLDRRVLQAMSGEYERAREPINPAPAEQQRLASAFIEALIAMREAHGGQPDMESHEILDRMAGLREELERASELSIQRMAICRAVRGFGQYDEISPPTFLAGRESEIVAYCELRDFASESLKDGQFESRFSMTITLLSASGDVALEMKDEGIVDRCRARRRDCFIPRLVRIPASLSPGDYVIKATVVDTIRNKVAQQTTPLKLVARS